MKYLGLLAVFSYRMGSRLKAKLFSILISGAFAGFGKRSVVTPPLRLSGEGRIKLGNGIFVGSASWLQSLPDGTNTLPALIIGDRVSIAGSCVISAVRSVQLEAEVLLARNVYISDHSHRYSDPERSILEQGIDKIAPVLIKQGAWLGQNVVVCPGVTIGRGAVVGSNSVVTTDVPDLSVAVGAPARVVKTLPSLSLTSRRVNQQ
jgi:carbonic anhydrase/acetyltransferase-like protein (isoleucine patch superfamily)